MKLLMENWRKYLTEEELIHKLLKENTALDEGAMRNAIKFIKDKFISAVGVLAGKENPLADFIIAYDDMLEAITI